MEAIATKIRKQCVKAINDYHMLEDGDKVLVAISGGKDSTILALMLKEIQSKAKIDFELDFLMVDQKQPGFFADNYIQWMHNQGIKVKILEEDTYSIVTDKVAKHKSFCGLCSRLRRGILYNYAHTHKHSKIALGHHRDDLNETILMNMFYAGTLASMPPKLRSDDGRNVIIRPLCYVAEENLKLYEKQLEIPVMPCNLCGSQDNLRRQKIKNLLSTLSGDEVELGAKMLAAQTNIKLSQLADSDLYNFKNL